MSIQAEFWGPYACFTRPEMKVERVSYDVPTPSAARGMLEAVYWHPGILWHIDRIYVLNPIEGRQTTEGEIETMSLRRNEMSSKILASDLRAAMQGAKKELYIATSQERQQRTALILKNVHYVVEAHFTLTDKAAPGDNPGKFQDIMKRRLDKGQCYHQPYFGCREFPAAFRRWVGGGVPTMPITRDLGYMLYDMDYSDPENIHPTFFHAMLENGVLETENCEVIS